MPGVLQPQAGASAEWYSERRALPEEKFQSALVSQLLASLGTSVPLLLQRLTRCQSFQDGRTRTERAHAADLNASSARHHGARERYKG